MTLARLIAPLAALALSACAHTPAAPPQDAFWSALQSHCGTAYAGELVSEDARDADWAGKRMIGHWAQCSADRVAIAFHVEDPEAPGGWNRSRTWIVTREIYENAAQTTTVLTLRHDHRHADGHTDAVTQYGGLTHDRGSARAQDFPVDMMSIALFEREGLAASLTNVWRIEVDPEGTPDARFAYQLTRRNDPTRRFRVELDASRPVPVPPPAWGW
ncbi:hypothetical protein K3172_03425 [Qipengyuania sp. 6B39]|uniref:hypothetical protein n=1 Tax=Qipengyuania proteolytica TaxID=2867239 RepID=UPI001C898EED|nr:hypothetical protein [Qipengyuania proteolytica]MBX7494906.1 hypothetical protein [Qipengyuania proteolytica]